MDGDLQNDPADIPRLLDKYASASADGRVLVAGIRVNRKDDWIKRASSRIANAFRRVVLQDGCEDTGCALKVFSREDFLALPPFDHIHRFLPAMFGASGVTAINVPVAHRPRTAGVSKYGVGNRLWVGLADVVGVFWLQRRLINPKTVGTKGQGR
jgi:dolichol-phosphate mannosyltransferase